MAMVVARECNFISVKRDKRKLSQTFVRLPLTNGPGGHLVPRLPASLKAGCNEAHSPDQYKITGNVPPTQPPQLVFLSSLIPFLFVLLYATASLTDSFSSQNAQKQFKHPLSHHLRPGQ